MPPSADLLSASAAGLLDDLVEVAEASWSSAAMDHDSRDPDKPGRLRTSIATVPAEHPVQAAKRKALQGSASVTRLRCHDLCS